MSLGMGTTSPAIAAELAAIPKPVIDDLLEDGADDWDPMDRLGLLRVLSRDPRASLRRRIAEDLASSAPLLPLSQALAITEQLAERRASGRAGRCCGHPRCAPRWRPRDRAGARGQ